MIRQIVHLEFVLSRPSQPATPEDAGIAQDLRDTLVANKDSCVGMAANMIGELKCIIAFYDGKTPRIMYNPSIVNETGPYDTEEGCLSLEGERPARRFKRITVAYEDEQFAHRTEKFTGFTAQIVQHEIDHCNGIVI
ncbi:MAG: peptide deformylase [Coriobacteriales bacterium]